MTKHIAQLNTRRKLPTRRNGFTQKVTIEGYTLYLHTGEFEDGSLGELFLTVGKYGSTLKHSVDALAMTISIGLQHGIPLQVFADTHLNSIAQPNGIVIGSSTVKFCSSIIDYVFQELQNHYIHNTITEEEEQIKPLSTPTSTFKSKPVMRNMQQSTHNQTGAVCPNCYNINLIKSGTCYTCQTCGETTGCS